MKQIQMHPLYPQAMQICQTLAENGFTAYFAGGCVRDALMGRSAHDLDIATSATPDQVAQLFTKTIPVGKAFGVMIVVLDQQQFEVATFRQDGLYQDGRRPATVLFCAPEEDAKRRDFTMNALFYDPIQEEVIDYVGGQSDIQKKRIVAVGDPQRRFQEDHLRLFRAVRFAAQLDFIIEEQTFLQIQKLAGLVTKVSFERLQQEIGKMILADFFLQKLDVILASQLLQELFVKPQFASELKASSVSESTADLQMQLWPQELDTLFHKNEMGRWIQFWLWLQNCLQISMSDVEVKLSQYRFSVAQKKCILQGLSWLQNQLQTELSLGAMVELAFEEGHRLGFQAVLSRQHLPESQLQHFSQALSIAQAYHFQPPAPFVRGTDLGLLQGVELGRALKKLYHLQLEGIVKTKSEALEFYQNEK